jgi:hypothetical protein
VHEAGHFPAATWQGVSVFSIGFGPVLLGKASAAACSSPSTLSPKTDPNLLSNRPLPQHASPAAHHEKETSHHLV